MQDRRYENVLDVVRRVLRTDTVDVRRNFFELDANSLAIVQIVSLVQHECGAEVSITDAFTADDVDAFAKLAAERSEPASETSL